MSTNDYESGERIKEENYMIFINNSMLREKLSEVEASIRDNKATYVSKINELIYEKTKAIEYYQVSSSAFEELSSRDKEVREDMRLLHNTSSIVKYNKEMDTIRLNVLEIRLASLQKKLAEKHNEERLN